MAYICRTTNSVALGHFEEVVLHLSERYYRVHAVLVSGYRSLTRMGNGPWEAVGSIEYSWLIVGSVRMDLVPSVKRRFKAIELKTFPSIEAALAYWRQVSETPADQLARIRRQGLRYTFDTPALA